MRLPDLLKRIAAEEQLFVKHRRQVNGDQFDPWKTVASNVVKTRREQNESVRGANEQDCGSASEEELARCESRRNEDAEVPGAVLEDRDRAEGRHADAEQRDPLVEKRAGELRYKTGDKACREVKRHEEAERGDDVR